jgi:hypothetical protein
MLTASKLPRKGYLLNVHLSPIRSHPFLVTMSFVEYRAWPVPTIADVLCDGWLGIQKLFHNIQESQTDNKKPKRP